MFDSEIPLFMLIMWITIISYFDCSHVYMEFQCIHTCMSFLSLLVWRTNVGRYEDRTVDVQITTWKYRRNRRIRI